MLVQNEGPNETTCAAQIAPLQIFNRHRACQYTRFSSFILIMSLPLEHELKKLRVRYSIGAAGGLLQRCCIQVVLQNCQSLSVCILTSPPGWPESIEYHLPGNVLAHSILRGGAAARVIILFILSTGSRQQLAFYVYDHSCPSPALHVVSRSLCCHGG